MASSVRAASEIPDKAPKLPLSARTTPTVKLVMTLLARNEADIIDAHLAFHLNAGVDFVIAIDNGSDDGTTEVLESYAHDGYVDVTYDADDQPDQGALVTRMARQAATDFAADWVINSDADEFWWPRGGSLKEVLAAAPSRYGSVRGLWRHFAPRPHGDEFFGERMTVRVCNPGAEETSPYSPRYKTAHRAHPKVTVLTGNHRADAPGLDAIPGWYPIDVLHFPIRSVEQCRQKYVRWWQIGPSTFRGAVNNADREGRMGEFYESYVVDDQALARGIAAGTLAVDTRLRDALRALRRGDPLGFRESTIDVGYLAELATLEDTDPRILAHWKADNLETRLTALERRPSRRILNVLTKRRDG
jgi:glycosyltransferase involved in cell wall biosynthesis